VSLPINGMPFSKKACKVSPIMPQLLISESVFL
jgi:hypothetical protein